MNDAPSPDRAIDAMEPTEDTRPEHERSPGTRSQDADGNFKYLGSIYCYYALSLAATAAQVKARKWEAGSASDRCRGVYLYNNELGDVIYVGQTIQLPTQRDSQHYCQDQEIDFYLRDQRDLGELGVKVCFAVIASRLFATKTERDAWLNHAESAMIAKYDTYRFANDEPNFSVFNLTLGGLYENRNTGFYGRQERVLSFEATKKVIAAEIAKNDAVKDEWCKVRSISHLPAFMRFLKGFLKEPATPRDILKRLPASPFSSYFQRGTWGGLDVLMGNSELRGLGEVGGSIPKHKVESRSARRMKDPWTLHASIEEAAEKTGAYKSNVCAVLAFQVYHANGYVFRYADDIRTMHLKYPALLGVRDTKRALLNHLLDQEVKGLPEHPKLKDVLKQPMGKHPMPCK